MRARDEPPPFHSSARPPLVQAWLPSSPTRAPQPPHTPSSGGALNLASIPPAPPALGVSRAAPAVRLCCMAGPVTFTGSRPRPALHCAQPHAQALHGQ